MKTAQLTVYDVLGYLVPGCVGLVGLLIAVNLCFDGMSIHFYSSELAGGAVFVVVSYILGHAFQSAGNMLTSSIPSVYESLCAKDSNNGIDGELAKAAQKIAHQLSGIPLQKTLSTRTIWELCDHYVQQCCRTENREIYVYRHGFYRGMFVAFALLSFAAFLSSLFSSSAVNLVIARLEWAKLPMAVLAGVSAVFAWLFYKRCGRFSRYLAMHSVLSSIIATRHSSRMLPDSKSSEDPQD